VDSEGNKHVLGIREGATENATAVTEPLEDIVARGVDPKRKMLFVVDGSKALRAAIHAVFGVHQPVQRCRAHKLRNAGVPSDGSLSMGWKVLDYLPKEQREQSKAGCGPPGSWMPKRAWRASRSWPSGWTGTTPQPLPVCWKA
jgi:hypothetical protein